MLDFGVGKWQDLIRSLLQSLSAFAFSRPRKGAQTVERLVVQGTIVEQQVVLPC